MPTLSIPINNPLSNINYLIYCAQTHECCVIDPLDADRILETALEYDLQITQIINTHEHADHTAGNQAIKKKTNAWIMAHYLAENLIPDFDKGLKSGDLIEIGNTIRLKVLETPGHTPYSLCLYDEANAALYTGDTLFNYGCGNCLHGGDMDALFHSLEDVLFPLPDTTKIYPGHDYRERNYAFALSLEPNSTAQSDDIHTTFAQEKAINPFFQLDNPALKKSLGLPMTTEKKTVFKILRELRNKW